MKSLIISADDFGLTDGVCRSVYELLGAGAISSTSLMLCTKDAINRIKQWHPKCLLGVAGVHLQLTSGMPLETTLQGKNCQFIDPRRKAIFTSTDIETITKEWQLQINVACELLQGMPTHLDSHHGVHRIKEIFPVYKQLAIEHGIPMRGIYEGELKELIMQNNLPATVAIVRNWTGNSLNSEELLKCLREIENSHKEENIIEIITHPGYSDPYLESISSLSRARKNDHNVLLHLAEINCWENLGFKLASYKDCFHERILKTC